MNEPLSTQRLQELLDELCRLVAERIPAESEIPAQFAAVKKETQQRFDQASRQTQRLYQEEKEATQQEFETARRDILARFESDQGDAQREYDRVRAEIKRRFKSDEATQQQQLQEVQWEATTVFEVAKTGALQRAKELKAQLDAESKKLNQIEQQAVWLLQKRSQWRDYPEVAAEDPPKDDDPLERFGELAAASENGLNELAQQGVARLFEGIRPLGVFLLVLLVAVVPSGLAMSWVPWKWGALSAGSALGIWVVITIILYRIAKRQSTEGYMALRQVIVRAERARGDVLQALRDGWLPQHEANVRTLNAELKKAEDRFAEAMGTLTGRRDDELNQAEQIYEPRLLEATARRNRDLPEADDRFTRRLEDLEQAYRAESDRLKTTHEHETAKNDKQFELRSAAMAQSWHQGIATFQASLNQINEKCDRLFPDWDQTDWDQWVWPTETPDAIRFGRHEVDLGRLEGGIPEDEQLRLEQTVFSMPALLSFSGRSLLSLEATGDGRAKAVDVMQAAMLRMLTAIPLGRVRFTIIDPVGLGQNFAAFMHLTDYDEQLVSRRIWTDPSHIDRQLTDLTEHMENVIQLYLRNEYRSIQDYNAIAGEMAEPYRILVVANYPAGFSESAAARLLSVVSSGARCGVFTLMSIDPKIQVPHDIHLADLKRHAQALRWKDGRFVSEHGQFGQLALDLDGPPAAEQFTPIVRCAGRQVKDADRVEVPFESIVPEPSQWWTADARAEISVPLGRAGATKLQALLLGKGTSQHALISGKTGSGKSTLLHALITALAVRYSPDEVELYLVDFKKGVEFKAYATWELPHARVIAIESEREFGLSVLERLDEELKRRGDLFRKTGVQDLKSFRAAEPDVVLPRTLLIIDEFQEFFVEDDRIGQTAALLLDRLVRQGRAFGVHVLLGSQTLAGAYTLARATIGQMAVRMALQCSEADAHLILSEENTAARLLNRPGEAIYNDANGRFEGNRPFQVAWLPDHERESYLKKIRQLADERPGNREPPIIFEGNVAADPRENPGLLKLLADARPAQPPSVPRAWLGAAVAIKDPAAIGFVRQEGSNLLIVGHEEDSVLGILANCLISFAAQIPPAAEDDAPPQFYVLDGTRGDDAQSGLWDRIARAVPNQVKLVRPRGVAEAIGQIAAEVTRREQASAEDDPPIFLIIHGLNRFRGLRRTEDNYGFSRMDDDAPPSPGTQFADILRDGPAFGVHSLIWCDTHSNVNRFFDRQAMHDLELRILFQMNATDSSHLIDSPLASRLGPHRAILHNEALGQQEKFRPYGPPTAEWLAEVKEYLQDVD